MRISTTAIAGVSVIDTDVVCDERGAFARLFCTDDLRPLLSERRIVQVNQSRTTRVGAIRGMHFQRSPHAEMKFVRCVRGRVWDVAVDLRAESPTFLRWHAEELSACNARMLGVPEGCAHGFQVLDPDSELLYLHTALYTPAAEGGVRYDDPLLGIGWPLTPLDLSMRDLQHALLTKKFSGLHG